MPLNSPPQSVSVSPPSQPLLLTVVASPADRFDDAVRTGVIEGCGRGSVELDPGNIPAVLRDRLCGGNAGQVRRARRPIAVCGRVPDPALAIASSGSGDLARVVDVQRPPGIVMVVWVPGLYTSPMFPVPS